MDANEEADFDALLILLHDWRSGGEYGNWNREIVGWANERLKPRTESAIQHTIRRLKPGYGENALSAMVAPTSPDASTQRRG